jgi:hypothetical protein
MELPGTKAKSLTVNLPFGLGSLEFEANEVEQRAAWSLYVELTREILREAGPAVSHGPASFGPVAIAVLNKGLRPFTSKWHPLLQSYEERRPSKVSPFEYERNWEHYQEMYQELVELQKQIAIYAEVLADIAGAK